jgi:aminoglycoside/choline kinase family phosphotransferase
LGNTTYLQALNANTAKPLYAAATDALIKIQLATRADELPPYDEALLRREMNLFPDWYIAQHLGVTLSEKQKFKLEEVFARIVKNNLAQPNVYVHRDFHSRNLMVSEPSSFSRLPHPNPLPKGEGATESRSDACSILPGIIDFQDAVYGPITYDLASLFKDAYIRWEEADIMDWLISYWESARKAGLPVRADFGEFYRDYEMMGAQRHLKVLGIFARLAIRDGKDGYVKDMPLVMDYLRRACVRYIDLKPLLNILDELEPQIKHADFSS